MWLFRSGLVLLAYTVMNIYAGLRLFALVKFFFPAFKALVFWPLFFAICYSMVLLYLLRLDRILVLRHASMYPLPAMVYLCIGLVFFDALLLCLRLFGTFTISPGFYAARTGVALFLALMTMLYGFFHAKDIKTVYYTISVDKEAFNFSDKALRVALISDLHIGGTTDRKRLSKMVDAVNAVKPDIILMAGDIFEGNISAMPDHEGKRAELMRFSAPLGVYAVPGNHDVDRIALRGGSSTLLIKNFLENAGIVFMEDEVRLIDNSFYLVGRRDMRPIGGAAERKSASELVRELDLSRPLIFMDHQPIDFGRIEEAGADLILSGHTHRGQFFPGNIATAYIFKKAGAVHYGYWRGTRAQAVVSSGIGVWALVLRIGTNSEVAVLDITFREGRI